MLEGIKRIIENICFNLNECKLKYEEEQNFSNVENASAHGTVQSYYLYKQCEVERAERKRLHQLRKQK